MLRGMEALLERCNGKLQDLDRSQKSQVFYESSKIESKISKIGSIPI